MKKQFAKGINLDSLLGCFGIGLAALSLFAAMFCLPAAADSPTINQYTLPSGSGPIDVAIDPSGNIWFSESNGQIGELPAGSTTSTTATQYNNLSGESPVAIASDSSGNIWFAEDSGDFIGELPAGSNSGTLASQYGLGGGVTGLSDLTIDKNNNIWFTESNSIGELPAGSTTSTTASQYTLPGGSDPIAITADPSGNIWFSESNGQIGELPAGSTTSTTATQYNNLSGKAPDGITSDSAGNIWFSETNGLGKFPAGSTTSTTATQFSLPSGSGIGTTIFNIATDSKNDVWFVGSTPDSIEGLPFDAISSTIPSQFLTANGSTPSGVLADASGNIWFGEATNAIGEFAAPAFPPVSSGSSGGSAGAKTSPKAPDTGQGLTQASIARPLLAGLSCVAGLYIVSARIKRPTANKGK